MPPLRDSSDTRWRLPLTVALALCLIYPLAGSAAESLSFRTARIDGGSWQAEGVEALIELDQSGALAAELLVTKLAMAAPLGEIRGLRLSCRSATVTAKEYRCDRARILVDQSPLDPGIFSSSLRFDPETRRLDVSSSDLPVLGQRLGVEGSWAPSGWTLRLQAGDIDAAQLYPRLREFYDELPELTVEGGTVSVSALMSSGKESPSIEATTVLRDISLTNQTGTLAAAGLAAQAQLQMIPDGSDTGFRYVLRMHSDAGEAYLEPTYLDLAAAPARVESRGVIDPVRGSLRIEDLDYRHPGIVSAGMQASLRIAEAVSLESAVLDLREAILPGAYATYLQGYLVGTPLAKLETLGRARGGARIVDDKLVSADLEFEGISADDTDRRLALYGANGALHWRRDLAQPTPPSRLHWDGGFIYRIGFGAGSAEFLLREDGVSLIGGIRLPVLDGALIVDTLEAAGLGSGAPSVDFDAELEPVDLRRLTTAIGWPAFPGTIAGKLPLLSFREGVVTVGASLTARVFDGTARVSDLRIEEPFGSNRRAAANIVLDNLDLGLITEVFTFGRIEGRLDGHIQGLRTLQGRPMTFDASFYTPTDDVSRHRISRRALNNLSEIAGAGTALLSSGFLSFFQDFGYRSLGISCRLEGDVCQMSGVEPAPDGYYLVKGSGLPRIDVIGHSREVNWPRLVSQIQTALESQEATTTQSSEGQK